LQRQKEKDIVESANSFKKTKTTTLF
jgi:hypothetical protein